MLFVCDNRPFHVRRETTLENLSPILILVAMFAIMYIFMIRPEKKRKKEAEAMRNSLVVGDEVITIGGITGTVCAVKETSVVLETGADRVRVELAKWGVSSKIVPEEKGKK